ncbi:MAG: hypothetical protein WCB04_11080 [Mycobacteriales bacterium]
MTHTSPDVVFRDCSTCGEQRAFEVLACSDGHGPDCPELACTVCGEAVLIGVFEFGDPAEVTRSPVAAAA